MYKKAKYILHVLHLKTKTRFGLESAYLVVLEESGLDIEIEDPQKRELCCVSEWGNKEGRVQSEYYRDFPSHFYKRKYEFKRMKTCS